MEGIIVLVLTRKLGEKVRIDDDVIVTVLEIQGSRVRIGIDAPPEVKITREELLGNAWPMRLSNRERGHEAAHASANQGVC
jgi:carbon storage regulator CsrA